jgi:hypothetical protein
VAVRAFAFSIVRRHFAQLDFERIRVGEEAVRVAAAGRSGSYTVAGSVGLCSQHAT